jgi:hypothetical protein
VFDCKQYIVCLIFLLQIGGIFVGEISQCLAPKKKQLHVVKNIDFGKTN